MIRNFQSMLLLFIITGCISCNPEREQLPSKIFDEMAPERSGIHFANTLTENDSVNYFNYMYIYMGGGVAIGDLNNDGLPDIYFTGNMVENKLYLNKGNLQFEDITQKARVAADDRWVTGVTLGDANQDGWLDIYVSVSGKWASTKNLLFINDARPGETPTFTESAESYGLADTGNSTQAVFLDYDLDGDQDLYVVNYPLASAGQIQNEYLNFREHTPYHKSDRLYRNEGNQQFTDVTQEAGLEKYGLSLGVSVGDYNQDGWPDIYVSNDFSTPDYFLINNRNGSFSDQNLTLTKHTSYFGMGCDAADFNNDGLLDLFQVDMLPEDNRRSKENMDSMNPERFDRLLKNNMHYQYSANTLQLNMGNDRNGLPRFGDIARMAGVSSTDWSWAALFADFDNDGYKDMFVTNGVRRDINNRDFFRSEEVKNYKDSETLKLTLKMPSEKIENYAFQNQGNLAFSDVSKQWGINYKGFSNGVAYGDLDGDGDLDLVVNNLDAKSLIYENKTSDTGANHYLRIKINGPASNAFGIGCKLWVEDKGEIQFQEVTLTRGFQSSVEPIVHFGTGKKSVLEKVRIRWQDGKEEILENVKTNRLITFDYRQAAPAKESAIQHTEVFFEDITAQVSLHHKHEENFFDDYRYQILLPHKISQYGPALAVADVNKDGLEDFYIGGAKGHSGKMFLQKEDGTFSEINPDVWEADQEQEDVSAVFFDANGDGALDLYVVCGGNEFESGSAYYQDKLYLNKGKGVFEKIKTGLPEMFTSGSCVVPADYDQDGDIDLFVGGRIVPRNYPASPQSYILKNESSDGQVKFVNATDAIAPELQSIGMVTQAEWLDVDNDKHLDLLLIGEWMGITCLKNRHGKFVNASESCGFSGTEGWWFGMLSEDFDQDGDRDLIIGNLGLNYKYQAKENAPFSLYTYDYDNDKRQDLVLSYSQNGEQYPVRGRECSSQQVPAIKAKFKNYRAFAQANLEEIYSTDHLQKSTRYQVKSFATCYAENLGNGRFALKPLDNLAQISSVNALLADDINQDGNPDVVFGGNLYGSEVETPRSDASFGGLLTGNGAGGFKTHMPYQSGLMISGEVKTLKKIKLAQGGEGILCAKNNDYLQLVKIIKPSL
ncbi:VCBS repeat-containing protein [Rapidithrix thailandica]|uniref:VCBS repeat-containing protein n=1 Tax=Rapidithrix thailandica TaxID=413964 RepID=A0AAW9SIY0_9BACT